MMRHYTTSLLLAILLACTTVRGDLDPFDQAILTGFYERHFSSNAALVWDTSVSLCNQTGVGCVPDGANERVSSLQLMNFNLTGTLPSSLFLLPELTFIDFSYNLFRGRIPTEIGLRDFTEINFSHNLLRGTIPTEIAQISTLTILNLESNTLSCPITPALALLPNLLTLNLQNNQLYGSIPSGLLTMGSISYIDLSNNFLGGSIPSIDPLAASASFLGTLMLDHNQLTSTIPSELAAFGFLTTLTLNDNKFYGRYPIGLNSSYFLSTLHLENNQLSGPLPDFSALAFYSELFLFGTNTFCPVFDTSTIAISFDTPAAPCNICSPTNCWAGTCVDHGSDYTCDCTGTPFSGDYCDQGTATCTHPCYNSGVCTRNNQCDCGTFGTSGKAFTFRGLACTNATRCYATASNDGIWLDSFPPDYRVGTCPPGYVGEPSRQCRIDGNWGPIFNPCVRIETCPSISNSETTWASSPTGTMVVGTCFPGFHGSPTRECKFDGTWADNFTPCQVNFCASTSDGITSWPQTHANTATYGSCVGGKIGRPYRNCDINGNFGAVQGVLCH